MNGRTSGLVAIATVSLVALVGCNGGNGVVAPLDFTTLAGNWPGNWTNTTFGSTGGAGLDITVDNVAQTAHVVVTLTGTVLGGPAPPPFALDGTYNGTAMTFNTNLPGLGDLAVEITTGGVLTASLTNMTNPLFTRVDLTGTVTGTEMNGRYRVTFSPAGGGAIADGVVGVAK
jgi:hypothetical protein